MSRNVPNKKKNPNTTVGREPNFTADCIGPPGCEDRVADSCLMTLQFETAAFCLFTNKIIIGGGLDPEKARIVAKYDDRGEVAKLQVPGEFPAQACQLDFIDQGDESEILITNLYVIFVF